MRAGLPPGFPLPEDPPGNPTTPAKVELGRHLFHDRRLSGNRTQACADCHRPALAFTDGRSRALGSMGAMHPRSAMSLTNVGYAARWTWVDATIPSLEAQALVPLLGEDPVEMGAAGRIPEVLARLDQDPAYARLVPAAFPGRRRLDLGLVTKALASFQRRLVSADSPYDRALWLDDAGALSQAAWRGLALFNAERLACSRCHAGPHLGGIAVPEAGATGRPPAPGLVTKVPTLRNIARTAPYLHDGSLPDLGAVLDHYAAGGRRPDGTRRPGLEPFALAPAERRDLLAFLAALTDEAFLTNPAFADPWVVRPR